ncbi:MAG TPA: SDR family NAD(P)-dependent oxidoreductase [Burkholderiales bacterium]|nr:SDR family NAD(P)-dependent oxidoreductase [Burkholderiales bacterium]
MSTSVFGLEGKSAIVLGGGQGMGESTAMRLAGAGCNVAVLDFDAGRAEAVAARVKGEGRKSVAIVADVLDDAKLKAAIAQAEQAMGGIDVMASIIGMAGWARLEDMTEAIWDLDHRRNLRYFFIAAKQVAAGMLKRQKPGALLGIASIDGVRSAPYHASYGAAKAGLLNLVRSMAVEWSPRGIRVNVIAPGSIVTPRIPVRQDGTEASLSVGVPMGRRGTTDEIAKAALFFLSDQASYVSGQWLAVDGGYLSSQLLDYESVLGQAGKGGTLGMSS